MPRRELDYEPEPDQTWPPPGEESWWRSDQFHGASGVGTRAARRSKTKQVRWSLVAALVAMVLFIGLLTVSCLDMRQGRMLGSDKAPVLAPSRTNLLDQNLASVDTIAEDLADHGFEVGPLTSITDQQLLAYEAVEVKINETPAIILTFKNQATTKKWAKTIRSPAVVGDNWGINVKDKALARRIAIKLGGDVQ